MDLTKDDAERPVIAHLDVEHHPGHRLRFAEWTGTKWSNRTLDTSDYILCPKVKMDSDRVTVTYATYRPWYYTLRLAERLAGVWNYRTVNESGTGMHALAVLPDGRRAVVFQTFYGGYDGFLLALEEGPGWNVTTVVPPTTYNVAIDSLDLAYWNGTFAVGYLRRTTSWETSLVLVRGDGTLWTTQTIARDVQGAFPSTWLAFDSQGKLHLAYAGNNRTVLNHLYEASGWKNEEVDRTVSPGEIFSWSLAVGRDQRPRLAYRVDDPRTNWTHRLMYAEREPAGWSYSEVSHQTNFGFYPWLSIDKQGFPHLAFTNVGWPQLSYDLWYATARPAQANRPPSATALATGFFREGSQVQFDASASSDPDGDPLRFRWDFESDGLWDTAFSSDPTAFHVWGDDTTAVVTVEVSDGRLTATAILHVTISNTAPSLAPFDVAVTGEANVTVRVAGEKFHDVAATLYRNGVPIATATIIRLSGSPGVQSRSLGQIVKSNDTYSITVSYSPSDDPENGETWGATPAWIVLEQGGSERRIHHTFTVRQPETWVWKVESVSTFVQPGSISLALPVQDPGSDDLVVTWQFGDGSAESQVFLNDPLAGPDPFPSADVHPRSLIVTSLHAFASPGTYTVTVTATDDDGGVTMSTLVIVVQ